MTTIKKARALPIFRMGETNFYVDTRLGEFREVDAAWNRISMDEIKTSASEATEFAFDRHTKNIYREHINPDHIPAHVKLVIVPPLSQLDPVGLARKFNLSAPADIILHANKRIRHNRGHRP